MFNEYQIEMIKRALHKLPIDAGEINDWEQILMKLEDVNAMYDELRNMVESMKSGGLVVHDSVPSHIASKFGNKAFELVDKYKDAKNED